MTLSIKFKYTDNTIKMTISVVYFLFMTSYRNSSKKPQAEHHVKVFQFLKDDFCRLLVFCMKKKLVCCFCREASVVIESFDTCMSAIPSEASCGDTATEALDELSDEVTEGFDDTCAGNCTSQTISVLNSLLWYYL